TEPIDVAFQRIHHSSPRSQCAILSALVQQQGTAPSGSAVGDVPFKLTRSITQERERRDRWENTQDNLFCMNALIDFRDVYERQAPGMTVRAFLDGEKLGKARFDDLRDPPVELERPLTADDPGRRATLEITRSGSGRLYYAARLFYSPAELKTEPIDVAFQRIHHSSPRSQCAILSALVQQQGTAPSGSAVGDVPFKLT
ncbi:MAG: hypothetical protein GY711_26875, partial [bacterium]|nr:hypothetical protein [bacterium]